MDKFQALHNFFSGFGLKAYNEVDLPTGANAPATPYLTYEVQVGDFSNSVSISFSIWYRSTTWEAVYRKSEEIRRALKFTKIIKYDNGCICAVLGSPMVQFMGDDADDKIKRAVFNLELTYIDIN